MIAVFIAALLLGILTLPPPLAWACLLGIGVLWLLTVPVGG